MPVTDKPHLVLIPGLICTRDLWAPQIAGLADLARVTIVDHSKVDTMAALASQVLAAAPANFALAGHSMGGHIALEIMRQAPDRIEKLALIATSARIDPPDIVKRRQDLIKIAGRGKFRGMSSVLLPSLVHPDRLGDRALIDMIYKMARETGPEGFVNQQRAILSRRDSRDILGSIECPTLVLVGLDDVRTPVAVHEELAAAIPNAELITLARCGHLPTLERPAATTAAMQRWLED
jgi:pimeloyl-ACP methyl ester carboxylesterase